MSSPIELLSTLIVGSVDYVSANDIRVVLAMNAPQATAINSGIPIGFPRINGYLLIPNEVGAVVGQISSLEVENAPYPKRTGFKDFGLIDMPFPLRKLRLTPVGTLTLVQVDERRELGLERGISVFPSVGDSVLLPTAEQLRSIIESGGKDCRVTIGTAPLANDAKVSVDPDRLFGRHLAVLGNTGSGKSCSVAGLIRWSIEAAEQHRKELGKKRGINARFIVLDPNGEYARSFADFGKSARVFKVPPVKNPSEAFTLPAWMWNSSEWSSFAAASQGSQRPMLMKALREMRNHIAATAPLERSIGRLFGARLRQLETLIAEPVTYSGTRASQAGAFIAALVPDARTYAREASPELAELLDSVAQIAEEVTQSRLWRSGKGYDSFSETQVRAVRNAVALVVKALPPIEEVTHGEDAPIPFAVPELPDHLDSIASEAGGAAQFVSYLSFRIRMMLADHRLSPVITPDQSLNFEQWLTNYIGADGAENGPLCIVDLSLVPADVLHIVVSVTARLIFEALQRYRRETNETLPTVLVMEEAHTFIQRFVHEQTDMVTAAQLCRSAFERIAREGRKFGLGLVLSSQRPAELSETVLAQCNTFLLHRIVNDRDQDLVGRLVPDSLGALLRDLPSLPARRAILLGWATPVPILVQMNELPEPLRPHSADPTYWDVWTGEVERSVDWSSIASEWTGR
ncbi:ATP-binding protein [Verrucomicrobiota bacterium sgz303538]